jgi:hypothetical protein
MIVFGPMDCLILHVDDLPSHEGDYLLGEKKVIQIGAPFAADPQAWI